MKFINLKEKTIKGSERKEKFGYGGYFYNLTAIFNDKMRWRSNKRCEKYLYTYIMYNQITLPNHNYTPDERKNGHKMYMHGKKST